LTGAAEARWGTGKGTSNERTGIDEGELPVVGARAVAVEDDIARVQIRVDEVVFEDHLEDGVQPLATRGKKEGGR